MQTFAIVFTTVCAVAAIGIAALIIDQNRERPPSAASEQTAAQSLPRTQSDDGRTCVYKDGGTSADIELCGPLVERIGDITIIEYRGSETWGYAKPQSVGDEANPLSSGYTTRYTQRNDDTASPVKIACVEYTHTSGEVFCGELIGGARVGGKGLVDAGGMTRSGTVLSIETHYR